jgi:hypothetical protein
MIPCKQFGGAAKAAASNRIYAKSLSAMFPFVLPTQNTIAPLILRSFEPAELRQRAKLAP